MSYAAKRILLSLPAACLLWGQAFASQLPAVSLRVEAPATAPLGADIPVRVTALDADGDAARGFIGTVYIVAKGDAAAKMPANRDHGYTFLPGENGTHLFATGVVFGTDGKKELSVIDLDDESIGGTATVTILKDACADAASKITLSAPKSVSSPSVSAVVSAPANCEIFLFLNGHPAGSARLGTGNSMTATLQGLVAGNNLVTARLTGGASASATVAYSSVSGSSSSSSGGSGSSSSSGGSSSSSSSSGGGVGSSSSSGGFSSSSSGGAGSSSSSSSGGVGSSSSSSGGSGSSSSSGGSGSSSSSGGSSSSSSSSGGGVGSSSSSSSGGVGSSSSSSGGSSGGSSSSGGVGSSSSSSGGSSGGSSSSGGAGSSSGALKGVSVSLLRGELSDGTATLDFSVLPDSPDIRNFRLLAGASCLALTDAAVSDEKSRLYGPDWKNYRWSPSSSGASAFAITALGKGGEPLGKSACMELSDGSCEIGAIAGLRSSADETALRSALSWDVHPDAAGYSVYRRGEDGELAFVAKVPGVSYSLAMAPGKAKFEEFAVRGVCKPGARASADIGNATRVQTGPESLLLVLAAALLAAARAVRKAAKSV